MTRVEPTVITSTDLMPSGNATSFGRRMACVLLFRKTDAWVMGWLQPVYTGWIYFVREVSICQGYIHFIDVCAGGAMDPRLRGGDGGGRGKVTERAG